MTILTRPITRHEHDKKLTGRPVYLGPAVWAAGDPPDTINFFYFVIFIYIF
jgi:hypothetical protein